MNVGRKKVFRMMEGMGKLRRRKKKDIGPRGRGRGAVIPRSVVGRPAGSGK
jgi:hypothetical protein